MKKLISTTENMGRFIRLRLKNDVISTTENIERFIQLRLRELIRGKEHKANNEFES